MLSRTRLAVWIGVVSLSGMLFAGMDPCRASDTVVVPTGCYEMGDHFNEGESYELPVHDVCITGFLMDTYEVTNAEYEQCVATEICTAPYYAQSRTRSSYYGNDTFNDFPVLYVSWTDAATYCNWMGKRLPTEAEWEYAARGGLEGKRYAKGDTIACSDANYGRDNSLSECWDYNGLQNDTHPVGTYAPNGYGLFDMDGNLAEYVNDWFDLEYYQFCVDYDVVNDPPGPPSGFWRTARTATYNAGSGDYVRVSARYLYDDLETSSNVGFRCAQDCGNSEETGLCNNGVDDDCDGRIDGADPDCPCVDDDADGYGDPTNPTCTHPELDCNDANKNIYPGNANTYCDCEAPYPQGTTEVCTGGVDEDCDGLTDDADPDCSGGACTASAAASTLEGSSVYGASDLGKHLVYLFLPVSVIIAVRTRRRRR